MKRIYILASVSFALFSVYLIPNLAYADNPGRLAVVDATEDGETAEDPDMATTSEEPSSTGDTSSESSKDLKLRLDKAKSKFAVRLNALEKARISGRCVGAQAKVKSRTVIASKASEARSKVYTNVLTRLNSLATTLDDKNIDTSTLKAQISELQTKLAILQTAQDTFKQSLSDLHQLDCKDDTEAFKSALEQARADQKTLIESAKSVREYLKNTVKPTLENLKNSADNQEGNSN